MSHTSKVQQFTAKNTAGILLCLAIAIPAWFLRQGRPGRGRPSLLYSYRHDRHPLFKGKMDSFKGGNHLCFQEGAPVCGSPAGIRSQPDRHPADRQTVPADHHRHHQYSADPGGDPEEGVQDPG